jgi:hypothetical protein
MWEDSCRINAGQVSIQNRHQFLAFPRRAW